MVTVWRISGKIITTELFSAVLTVLCMTIVHSDMLKRLIVGLGLIVGFDFYAFV